MRTLVPDEMVMDSLFEELLSDERIRLISRLADSAETRVWLVGGCLRDALTGRQVRDYDFALDKAVEELPREFASRIGGKFFWLDRERRQSRVVKGKGEETLTWDFAPIRGSDILEDLTQRDFTVNSLALPVGGEVRHLLDPLEGVSDIRSGAIRSPAEESFDDDPLRLLRAFRFSATLRFRIEDDTLLAIKRKASLLSRVAGERLRDELFLILSEPHVDTSLEALRGAGLLHLILPVDADPLPEIRERIARTARVEETALGLERLFPDDRQLFAERLLHPVEGRVNVLSLVKLAGFLAGAHSRARIEAAGERLHLGTKAVFELNMLCDSAERFPRIPEEGSEIRPFYRFFRDRRPAGPELLLLPLSERLVTPGPAVRLASFFFHDYRPSDRDLLLSGDQVMEILGICPGPGLGRCMEDLREAESLGLVSTEAEARAFIRKKQLTKEGPMG